MRCDNRGIRLKSADKDGDFDRKPESPGSAHGGEYRNLHCHAYRSVIKWTQNVLKCCFYFLFASSKLMRIYFKDFLIFQFVVDILNTK